MDAILTGGGVCAETALGCHRRLDQQEERMQEEALQLVSVATTQLRRRLRAMELKMESTHGEAAAAAAALRGQVARMERLEDKMAAVERRLRTATGPRGASDDDKMAAIGRLLRTATDLHGGEGDGDDDEDDKMAAVERLLRSATGLDGEGDDVDDDKMAAVVRLLRSATGVDGEGDDDGKMAAVERLLHNATSLDGEGDNDKMALLHNSTCLGGDDDKMAAVEPRLRSATGFDGESDAEDDSSGPSAASSGGDVYPACPRCATSSSSSVLSGASRPSCFAADEDRVPDASLLVPVAEIPPLVPEENVSPARSLLKRRRCGNRLDSPHLSSTASVDAPMAKASRLESTAQTTPNVSTKQTSSTPSSFSRRLCGVFCDSSASSNVLPNQETSRVDSNVQTVSSVFEKHVHSARSSFSRLCGPNLHSSSASSNAVIAFPNQMTSRVDCNVQTVASVFEKRVHSARSSFSRLCGPILDSSSASFPVGASFASQKAPRLDAIAQTCPLVPDERASPAPPSPRRLCKRLLGSLPVPVTTDAALRNQDALRLDSTSQTASTVSDKRKGNILTRRFESHVSDLLESSPAAPSAFPNVSRLDPNAQVPVVFDKCASCTSSAFCELSSPLSKTGSESIPTVSFQTLRTSNVAAQIPDKHMSPDDTSLSRGLYQVLRSAAALAGRPFLPTVETIPRLTPSTDVRADANDRLHLSGEESPPDGSTVAPPACDVASKSTASVCPEIFSCPRRASACTQTDDVLGNCAYSLQALFSGLLSTSGYVAPEAEDCRMSGSLSRRSSSLVCHCPSTAGKSVSGCYTADKVSRSTSCATFSNTNIGSSSGFYDCEDNSQASSISVYDEPSQCSSFYPFSERITQHVVWMSSAYNPSLYYCVPLINSSFCTISCNEDASDMPTVTPDSPWSVSDPQSCFQLCDVAPPVLSLTKESKSSCGPRAISYAPHRSVTTLARPPSSVTNYCTGCVLKSIPEATHIEQSTITPDVLISFSEPKSSSPAMNVSLPISTSDKPLSANETSDCLIATPRQPSSPEPLAREGPPQETPSGLRKSESSWSLLSSCSASRPTSCGPSAQVTPSCSSNLGCSNHSSESKIESTGTPKPPRSQSTSLAGVMPPSGNIGNSSATSVTKKIQDTTCDEPSTCSPDVSLSTSQPTSHSPSLHDTSSASDSPSSNVNNTPVTLHQSAMAPLDEVVSLSKTSLHSSCSPGIITIRRASSSSVSLSPIERITSALDSRDIKYQVLSRPSSPEIPPAPPPTPLSHISRKTISRTTIIIHSNAETPCSSTFRTSQPPSDGCFPDKAADHFSSDVRQFSSKTVILPKNIIRPSIPHIHSPIVRPFSGCASTKEDSRPLSGYPVEKGISETTFVIDSPKSTNRPCVSPSAVRRPNSSSLRARDPGRSPSSVRKLISETTFVVDCPKRIARPTVSCDDSKLARRSVKFNSHVSLRGASPGRRAFTKAPSKPHSVESVMDLPSCARRALPTRTMMTTAAAAAVPEWARPALSRAKILRSRSAEVKLGRRLLKAAQDGKAPAVRKLLDDGADVNFTFATKWTALHRAVKMGHEEVVCVLLAWGADVEAKTTYDFTALHIAAYYDHKGMCLARLIDAGSDLGSRNRSGKTPLHYASEVGNKMAVRALVVAGANKTTLDDDGKTPFDVAKVDDVRGLLASAGKPGKAVVRSG